MPVRRSLLPSLPALLLAALLATACSSPPGGGAPPAAAPTPPRLVVFFVVDGLPMRQVTAYRSQLAPDGLARFLARGAWYADAHYGHSYTVTAAGHATMLTGAYPHRSGIIGNEWRDPDSGAAVYCTGDTTARYIGHDTKPLDGTSPRNLLAETVGDLLRRRDPQAKVIGISGKDRGAILPAGRSGTAYMYMASSGRFASSTYYMPSHPAWVEAYDATKPADRFFKAQWKPALDEPAYAQSLGDNQPWFGTRVGKLPMSYGASDDKPGPGFYASLMLGPFGDQLTLDFARAALAGERLGQDEVPDILSISLSGHDYVNHAWSAESRLSHDHLLQLDRMLQAFFQHLDASVGRDRYVAVLTADHGFMPSPEVSRLRGLDAGYVSGSEALAAVNAGLQQRFGVPGLAAFTTASTLVLQRRLVAEKQLDAEAVAAAARDLLLAQPGFAAAYTRRELQTGSRAGQPFFEAMQRSFHVLRSGDVAYVLKPNWMGRSAGTNATHGSPHAYDTQVPILLWGPAWFGSGRVDTRVEVADIAPTLSALLKLPAPAASEGRPLPLPRR